MLLYLQQKIPDYNIASLFDIIYLSVSIKFD